MRQRAVILTGSDGTKYGYGPFRKDERAEAFAERLDAEFGGAHEIEVVTLEAPELD